MENRFKKASRRIRRVSAALLFTLCASQITGRAQPANAATFYVALTGSDSNTGALAKPFLTLQRAVNAAALNDTILVENGIYTGAKNREIDFGGKDLIVKSVNGAANCIINCQKAGRAFNLTGGETTASRIDGLTIENGSVTGYGGGIFVSGSSNATVANCTFTNNAAAYVSGPFGGGSGGGGALFGGTAVNCAFTSNTATGASGGGGGMYGGTASGCTFTTNTADASGGAIYEGIASGCTFNKNVSHGSGGAIGGSTFGSGGAADNCAFTGNTAASSGGAMYLGVATGCAFTGNTAVISGGGLYAATGAIGGGGRADRCSFISNSAGVGGGMYNGALSRCLFLNNKATTGSGGGYVGAGYNSFNASFVVDCLFAGNNAKTFGGGTVDAPLLFCTVANNVAQGSYGGGVYNTSANYVTNCIVWGNTAAANSFNIKSNGATTVTYSAVQGGSIGLGNLNNADPLFVNAAGGDYHLSAASPCIDAGTASGVSLPPTDLDGAPRVVGKMADMGCYEFGRVVSGALIFEQIASVAPPQNVTFQLRPVGGETPTTQSVSVPYTGAFRLVVPNGNYTLWIKPDTSLAVSLPVDVSSGNASGLTAMMSGGDANNDNSVDSTDFGILIGAFNTQISLPGGGYDPAADFNGDGSVDSSDFGMLIGNFNTMGAP